MAMVKKWMFLSILLFFSFNFCPLIADSNQIKIVAFDLHGVLFQRCKPLSTSIWEVIVNAENKLNVFLTAINPFFWTKAYSMTNGTYSCENALKELSSYDAVKRNYDELFHACNDYCPMPENIELIKTLKNHGVELVLASNIGRESFEYEKKNSELAPTLDLFDYIHFAHIDKNSAKPLPEYFVALRQAIDAYFGVTNNIQILFVDDNYKNVKGAEQANEKYGLNIKAVPYKNLEQLTQVLIDEGYISKGDKNIKNVKRCL